jgi:hypothetical protein
MGIPARIRQAIGNSDKSGGKPAEAKLASKPS